MAHSSAMEERREPVYGQRYHVRPTDVLAAGQRLGFGDAAGAIRGC